MAAHLYSEKAARGSSGGAVSGKGGKGFSIDPRILKQMKKGTKLVNRPQGLAHFNFYQNSKNRFLDNFLKNFFLISWN